MASEEAFDAFYRSTYDRTVGYLLAMLGDAAEAQDVAQEAYCRAWRRWPQVEPMADPEAWVRTVAWRVGANHLRHLKVAARRRSLIPGVQAPALPGVETLALVTALKHVEAPLRQALVLHYLLDLNLQQVADETGVSLSAAKARLVRGRAALTALLRPTQEARDA